MAIGAGATARDRSPGRGPRDRGPVELAERAGPRARSPPGTPAFRHSRPVSLPSVSGANPAVLSMPSPSSAARPCGCRAARGENDATAGCLVEAADRPALGVPLVLDHLVRLVERPALNSAMPRQPSASSRLGRGGGCRWRRGRVRDRAQLRLGTPAASSVVAPSAAATQDHRGAVAAAGDRRSSADHGIAPCRAAVLQLRLLLAVIADVDVDEAFPSPQQHERVRLVPHRRNGSKTKPSCAAARFPHRRGHPHESRTVASAPTTRSPGPESPRRPQAAASRRLSPRSDPIPHARDLAAGAPCQTSTSAPSMRRLNAGWRAPASRAAG